MDKIDYHDINYCPKCGMHTNIIEPITYDGGNMSEAKTKCRMCSHENYYAYGFYDNRDMVIHENARRK